MTSSSRLKRISSRLNARRGCVTRAEIFALIAVAALAAAFVGPLLSGAGQKAQRASTLAKCQENLRQIGTAFQAYLQDSQTLPVSAALTGPHPELVHAVGGRYVTDPRLFYCPAEPSLSAVSTTLDARWTRGDIGYFYYSAESHGTDDTLSRFLLVDSLWPRHLTKTMPADTWVMSDKWFSAVPTTHPEYKKGVNYLMLDGSVEFIAESIRTVFK